MTINAEMLSAYLDGELDAAATKEVEAALETSPELVAELESLTQVDDLVRAEMDALMNEPVPLDLASKINNIPEHQPANTNATPRSAVWQAVAVVALLVGGAGGYFTGVQSVPTLSQERTWLTDIADYHRIYSTQKRHLVEVSATEADHIETWLSNTIGAPVLVPDLSEFGLTFQGARLLVAVGKPVAQLVFTNETGEVVALCLIQSDTPREGIGQTTLGGFQMVSWGGTGSNLVLVGDEDRFDLKDISDKLGAEV